MIETNSVFIKKK